MLVDTLIVCFLLLLVIQIYLAFTTIEGFEGEYKEYDKNYREDNKDKISEKKKEKIMCECGSITSKNNILRHKKSNKHIALMENLNQQLIY